MATEVILTPKPREPQYKLIIYRSISLFPVISKLYDSVRNTQLITRNTLNLRVYRIPNIILEIAHQKKSLSILFVEIVQAFNIRAYCKNVCYIKQDKAYSDL